MCGGSPTPCPVLHKRERTRRAEPETRLGRADCVPPPPAAIIAAKVLLRGSRYEKDCVCALHPRCWNIADCFGPKACVGTRTWPSHIAALAQCSARRSGKCARRGGHHHCEGGLNCGQAPHSPRQRVQAHPYALCPKGGEHRSCRC